MQLANALARLNEEIDSPQLRNAEKNLGKFAGSQQEAAKAADKQNQSLANTRYALYDVSQTLATAGALMLGLSVATIGTAIAFERSFADVVRTSGVTGDAIASLRADFIDLAQTIPLSFEEITKIGTLGGQLGIAANDLTAFTRTVAEFSAVTGVSVEAAGTAFGRLNALLPDVKGNFSALGSSIALVGVESVATEAEIIKTATQLSAVSKNAGLTSREVIGLAGAFASIGVSPELARGTAVRVFTLIGRAAGEGGEKLDAFAKIAGVSGQELANAYGTERFGPIFQSFLAGLNDISEGGGDLNSTLSELGVNSVRDRPALINLATALGQTGVAGDLVAESIANANKGFEENTELSRQYGIIADTTASKLTLLANNFQVFLDSVGSGATGPIGNAIDGLNQLLNIMTDIASGSNGLGGVVVVLAGLAGAFAIVVAGGIAAFAGILAVQQALVGLGVPLTSANIGLTGLSAQLAASGTAGLVASRGIAAASAAVRSLGIAIATIGAGLAIEGVTDLAGQLSDFDRDFESALDRVTGATNRYSLSTELAKLSLSGFNRELGTSFLNSNPILNDLARVDEGLAKIAKAGGAADAAAELQKIDLAFSQGGKSIDDLRGQFVDTFAALEKSGYSFGIAETGLLEIIPPTEEAAAALGEMGLAEDIAAEKAQSMADQLGLSVEVFKTFIGSLTSGVESFTGFGTVLGIVQEQTKAWAEGQAANSEDATDSWEDFYDGSSVSLSQFSEALSAQIAAAESWATNVAILAGRGASNFAAELAKLGPEGAQLAAEAVNATAEELGALEEKSGRAALLATDAFQNQLIAAGPLFAQAQATAGQEAVTALRDAMISGSPAAVQAVVRQYNLNASNLPIEFQTSVNTDAAARQVTQFVRDQSGRTITLTTTTTGRPVNQGAFASGGPVYGPGTGTSDSIPARLSHGEYVIKASSVRQYGTGLFDRLNRGVAKFASGGYVGGYARSAPSGSPGMTVVELSSYDRALLQRIPEGLRLQVEGRTIASVANNANANSARTGSN